MTPKRKKEKAKKSSGKKTQEEKEKRVPIGTPEVTKRGHPVYEVEGGGYARPATKGRMMYITDPPSRRGLIGTVVPANLRCTPANKLAEEFDRTDPVRKLET